MSDNCLKQAQNNALSYQIKRNGQGGSGTHDLSQLCKGSPISCLKGLQLLSENLEFKIQPLHYLASFFLRLRLTVHGCGAKNTASIRTKSFQGFDG
jgi:hypothetical protein